MNIPRTFLAAPAVGIAALLLTGAPALASSAESGSAMADLQPVALNDAPGSGSAMVEVDGTTLSFTLAYEGLLADAPHAAHIHYSDDTPGICPTPEQDADDSGTLNTTETAVGYGGIIVSLTTEGDTSPDSGLAIDRFGVGDDVSYSRGDVEVTAEVAEDILSGEAAVVVHGVDHDGSGAYDGDTMSDLDPSLPTEATDPALCGILQASQMDEVPAGGVDTGQAAVGGQSLAVAGGGAAALLAGGALLVARRRTATES
ncbi:CHRD domain-containing protein [Aquipuribacter sp. MA13-6]|uniref:CHRD domain-containing protein n=1 Tax=unclassified Aquipuribacter TaxID=2635084 RepID=UPI003EEB981A